MLINRKVKRKLFLLFCNTEKQFKPLMSFVILSWEGNQMCQDEM